MTKNTYQEKDTQKQDKYQDKYKDKYKDDKTTNTYKKEPYGEYESEEEEQKDKTY